MSTFLIIKPDFEKITNLKKGWTQSGNMLQGVHPKVAQNAVGQGTKSGAYGVASSFGGETGFMILWILELVSYLSVLSWRISFQLVEKPAEIKLIIIPDDFRNFIDGIGCCFK